MLIPVSGGGLASGIGTAIKARCPNAKVFGVEPELAADTTEGLKRGERVDWSIEDRNRTIADGLRSQPSALTFAHLQRVIDGMITVSENEIRAAVRELAVNAHLVSEPSGAVALAAYRQNRYANGRDGDDPVRRQCRTVGSGRHPGLKIRSATFFRFADRTVRRGRNRAPGQRGFARHREGRRRRPPEGGCITRSR